MSRHTRREFLKGSAVAAATIAVPMVASSRVLGANDAIHIGVAGINGRGGAHIGAWGDIKGVRVSHLIDPDSRLFEFRTKLVEKASGSKPKCFQDIRKALEDKELDAISIASCNHWHSLLTVWACQAGKDVYVEKPCSHNVFEGRKCVEAARKYKRIVSHGTGMRGTKTWAQIAAVVKSGRYGKLLVSKGYASKGSATGRWSIGFREPKEPPKGLDFDLWLGPAPVQPYHENIVHYNWHWFWDFGNGEIGNQGAHQMDIARWCIPGATLPKSVICLGGRYVETADYKDQAQTPNFQIAVMDFGGPLLVFEVLGMCDRKGPTGKIWPGKVDNELYFEEGMIASGRDRRQKLSGPMFIPKGKTEGQPLDEVQIDQPFGDDGFIFQNFIDCVRSRKQEDLVADIEVAHLSSALCHLANASYRLGKQVPFGQGYEAAGDNQQVRDSIRAMEENLKTVLGMDLSKQTYCLGPQLEVDARAEKFLGNDAANKLLTRPYRTPYVVPEQV